MMKKIFQIIAISVVAVYKKVTGKKGGVAVKLPDNIAIAPEDIDKCIAVVNTVKDIVDNGLIVLLTELTPIPWDNVLREKLHNGVLEATAGLTYSKQLLTSTDKNATLNELLNKVRFSADEDKNSFYHSLVIRLIMIASDGKVTWSEAASFIELYFKQVFNPNKQ